jgi:hypothetical protein
MSAVEDIRIKLEQRLREVDQEIESLRSALTALDVEEAAAQAAGIAAPPEAGSDPPPEIKARRRGGRRGRAGAPAGESNGSTDITSSAELERLLAETGGSTAVELARQTGTDYGVVLARIRQLERAGQGRH